MISKPIKKIIAKQPEKSTAQEGKGRKVNLCKQDLITAMTMATGITKDQANSALNASIKSISDTLIKGGRADIHGLGVFATVQHKAKKGRNPKTGEPITIPEKKRVKFRPAKSVADSLTV
jgi:DNA-binding protein HU-beta